MTTPASRRLCGPNRQPPTVHHPDRTTCDYCGEDVAPDALVEFPGLCRPCDETAHREGDERAPDILAAWDAAFYARQGARPARYRSSEEDPDARGATLPEIVAVNRDDPPVGLYRDLRELRPGEHVDHGGGAHGITTWTRTE